MFNSMHARLAVIGEEDSDREEELGAACPAKLDLFLGGGHVLRDVRLVDGLNSVDDRTIDVRLLHRDTAYADRFWVIGIDAIAMVQVTYPTEADRLLARVEVPA